ncbi:S-layer homology domain-containing protein [Paenibacillus sp. MMO-177]|uniref:S-layer homology domain-containing protein n=1 Tax=Paenibacillus sp. MMO-177 TaxID=3081289 RepID=UPI0030193B2E
MKAFTRSLIVFLAAVLLLALPFQASKVSAASAEDTLYAYMPMDIDEHWAYEALDNFVSADLLKGYTDSYGDTYLKPDLSISRAEFVSILVRALGLTTEEAGKSFADVPNGKWYSEPIRIASSLGVVNGLTDTTFGPNELVKRGEIATMVVRAFESSVKFEGEAKSFSDVPEYFATPFIAKASQAGIVRGATATTFKPYANATRAEAVVMIQRALDLQKSDLPEDTVLNAVINEENAKEVEAVNAEEYDKLGEIQAQYYTGYQLAASFWDGEDLAALKEQGYKMAFELTAPASFEVVSKSNRFAVIHTTGGKINMKLEGPDMTHTQIIPTDATYYLKKMPDNSWKIYYMYEDDPEYSEDDFGL